MSYKDVGIVHLLQEWQFLSVGIFLTMYLSNPIYPVTNHKSQICNCDTQTQIRYGYAPLSQEETNVNYDRGWGLGHFLPTCMG
jgi:hypothetical protein